MRLVAEYKAVYYSGNEVDSKDVWNHALFNQNQELGKGNIEGAVGRKEYFNQGVGCLDFGAQGYIKVLNCDEINLQKWKFHIEFSIEDSNWGCFIFDKRNGQWHRNYCFGYITEEWFKNHPCDLESGHYLFVDLGDGRHIEHELNNGISIKADLQGNITYEADMSYDGQKLILQFGGYTSVKNIDMKSITGGGNLIIGSMGEPYTGAFSEYGLGMFKGKIKLLQMWDLEDE